MACAGWPPRPLADRGGRPRRTRAGPGRGTGAHEGRAAGRIQGPGGAPVVGAARPGACARRGFWVMRGAGDPQWRADPYVNPVVDADSDFARRAGLTAEREAQLRAGAAAILAAGPLTRE